jgi:MFS family permease
MTARTDRLLLANAMMGQFLSGFATRIFIVSLPTIAATLNADILAISWALIAYQLAGISLSVVFGRLGDVRGRYTIYGAGFAIMAASSLLCGFAPNVLLLILFRFVQGIGAAMIASAARVLAMEAMPGGSEGRANGFMTTAFHSGFLIGPPVGGLVIDAMSWRWVFFLLVPMAVTGVILTAVKAKGRRAPSGGRPPSIDYGGAALLIVLTVTLTLLLDRRSTEMTGAGQKGLLVLAFAATFLGFLVHERRAINPVVNFSLFKIRMFTFSILSLLIIATTTSVLGFLMPFYLQDVLHLSPSFMGLIFLAAPVFTIALATASGQLSVDGADGAGIGALQHAQPDRDHRLGAERIPGLRDRDRTDGVRHGFAARDLSGRRPLDRDVPALLGDPRRPAECRPSPRVRRVDECHLPGVPRAHVRRPRRLSHARPHPDRGRGVDDDDLSGRIRTLLAVAPAP